MDDYLAKPVGLDQLRTCVSGWLGGRGHTAANSSAQPPAATGEASKPVTVLDDKVLHELKEIMEDDYVSLLRTYLRNAPELLAELEAAAKRGDVEAMIRPVHSLKSSSANVGAVHLSALARDVEQHARARDFGAAKLALADLYAAFADAEQALRAHVASASAA
jgi:HPt (histidine-containing phosphotransfer) domain-containing protein